MRGLDVVQAGGVTEALKGCVMQKERSVVKVEEGSLQVTKLEKARQAFVRRPIYPDMVTVNMKTSGTIFLVTAMLIVMIMCFTAVTSTGIERHGNPLYLFGTPFILIPLIWSTSLRESFHAWRASRYSALVWEKDPEFAMEALQLYHAQYAQLPRIRDSKRSIFGLVACVPLLFLSYEIGDMVLEYLVSVQPAWFITLAKFLGKEGVAHLYNFCRSMVTAFIVVWGTVLYSDLLFKKGALDLLKKEREELKLIAPMVFDEEQLKGGLSEPEHSSNRGALTYEHEPTKQVPDKHDVSIQSNHHLTAPLKMI